MPAERDRSQDVLFSLIKTVARHSAVYGIFDFLGKAGAFLLVPLYARIMSPAEYGTLEILTVSYALALTVVLLGFNSALVRYYTVTGDAGARADYFRTAFTTVVGFALLAALGLLLAAPVLSRTFFGDTAHAGLWRLLLLWVVIDAAGTMFLSLFRSQGRPFRYSAVNLLKLLGVLGLNVVLVGVLRLGVRGALTGNVLGALLGATAGGTLAAREFGIGIRRETLRDLARFGLPLVASGIGLYVMNSADRFFLGRMTDLTQLGIYSLGYKVGLAMSVVLNAFVVAWPPVMFRIAQVADAPAIFARILTYYVFVTGLILVLISSFSGEIVSLIAVPAYAPAAGLVPLILLAYLLQGVYYIFSVGVTVTDRTVWVPVVVGLAAAVNLAANFVLIPAYGIWGAAWATLASFLCLPAAMWPAARRYYPMAVEGRRLILVAAGVGAALVLNLAVIGSGGPATAAAKAGVVAALPFVLLAAGFFSSEERLRLRLLAGRLGRRLGPRR